MHVQPSKAKGKNVKEVCIALVQYTCVYLLLLRETTFLLNLGIGNLVVRNKRLTVAHFSISHTPIFYHFTLYLNHWTRCPLNSQEARYQLVCWRVPVLALLHRISFFFPIKLEGRGTSYEGVGVCLKVQTKSKIVSEQNLRSRSWILESVTPALT